MKVGILGGGQLARMLCLAGYPLGIRGKVVDPGLSEPCQQLTYLKQANYEDTTTIAEFFSDCLAVTYEFENVPAETLSGLPVKLYPGVDALATAQDRLKEKTLFTQLGIPTAPFVAIASAIDLAEAQSKHPELFPAIAKARRGGYDGKGQRRVQRSDDASEVWASLGQNPLILEKQLNFTAECSMIMVRSSDGQTGFYPLTYNIHQDGILKVSLAPAPFLPEPLGRQAKNYVQLLAANLDYVGVLALELFVVDNQLYANEFAPRVHNSGHWTMNGAITSQFENHLRAICGLPLGDCRPIGYSAMINLIGEVGNYQQLLQHPGTKLHLYEKQPRPQRKLGHLNFQTNDFLDLQRWLAQHEVHLDQLITDAGGN